MNLTKIIQTECYKAARFNFMTRLKQTGLDATIKFCESIWLVEINPIYAAQKFNHLSHIV